MSRPSRTPKPKPDVNQIAYATAQQATLAVAESSTPRLEKNPAAVAMGKLGGPKGGAARAASLTPKRRSDIAKKAAKARWAK